MMIKPELAMKMIEQVRNELAASLQYLAIAIYFEQESMDNTAAFFYAQAQEENEHGMKLLRYVVETGGSVELLAIPAPVARINSAEDAHFGHLHKNISRKLPFLVNFLSPGFELRVYEARDALSHQFLNIGSHDSASAGMDPHLLVF